VAPERVVDAVLDLMPPDMAAADAATDATLAS
jgi:hypothetical protein